MPATLEAEDQKIDFSDLIEIHLSGTAQERTSEGLIEKEILRTGEWPVIPTAGGIVKKPLRVVRDGKSDKDAGVISLSEVVDNYNAGVLDRVQIPLSDDKRDHKNITRLNTGFVRKLFIRDEENGSKLVAAMEFTEPDIGEKVLRGTYADVSCGIPWEIVSRGKKYGATLEHVALTNRGFIDGLGPFLAMSDVDEENVEVNHFGETVEEEPVTPDPEPEPEITQMSLAEMAQNSLVNDLHLSSDHYSISDISGSQATVTNSFVGSSWIAPYTITTDNTANTDFKLTLSDPGKWEKKNDEEDQSDVPEIPVKESAPRDSLVEAHHLRELRLSQPTGNNSGGSAMPETLGIDVLDKLELNDEARVAIQTVLNEKAELSARVREQEVDARITELSDLGLKERPGALKFYREVFLSDDGGPAVVLLSDEGSEKERLSALEILDRFIEGIKGSDDKVTLSDQVLASGNDDPPPATPEGENKPVEERLKEAKRDLYGEEK